jgi:uncharacterized membrane protein YtjA (UPF0391 family)
MLGWAVTFLIIALIAAVLGFGGIAAASAGIAKFLFFLFLVMCVIFFVFGWRGRRGSINYRLPQAVVVLDITTAPVAWGYARHEMFLSQLVARWSADSMCGKKVRSWRLPRRLGRDENLELGSEKLNSP